MLHRRDALSRIGLPLVAASMTLGPRRALAVLAAAATEELSPTEIAADESFWSEISHAFPVDRSITNLNNGGVSPSPALVQEAMGRHLAFSNEAPPYTMWRVLEPRREQVRERLARGWGVDPEEIALTRNTSEGLQICQFGFDLQPGDEVVTSTQDYPRMLTTFEQRVRREGIVLNKVQLPTPFDDDAEVVRRFEAALTDRTRLLLLSHVLYLNGQILPVREVLAMARRHGVSCLVDGAHAFAHLDFNLAELDCDFYATSLHKWLCAPHGTGMLYVRREKIADLWPLMAADASLGTDIRKFEEIGTHPAANTLAVEEALSFHESLGAARKEARLIALRDRWARPLQEHDSVRLHTSLAPGFACGIATFQIDGIDSRSLKRHLWQDHRILTRAIVHDDLQGVRVSPSVYTTPAEIDRFVEVVEGVIANGLPG